MIRTRNEHVDGMLRGALGSLAGLGAMALFFRAMQALSNGAGDGREEGEDFVERHDELDDVSMVGQQTRDDEPATATVGRIAYEQATGHEPDDEVKQKLGQGVHWGYGVLVGGIYGALRPSASAPDLAAGLGYGTALWLIGDEIMVPLLGLAEGPTGHSISEHASALGAHLAYGAATASATQALKHIM